MLRTRIDGRFLALDYGSDEVNEFSSSLAEWLSLAETKSLVKVSYAEKYPMKSRLKLPRGFKTAKRYAIRTGSKREIIIHRSWNEIKALRLDLVEGFSGAFVPSLPDSNVKNALNLFFDFLTSNPYFRHDKSIQNFLDPNVPCFKKWLKTTKKNGNCSDSIGRRRWLQALCQEKGHQTRCFSDNVFYYEKIKDEFNLVLSFLLDLKKTVKLQMEILEKQALSFNNLHDSLTNMLSVESNLEELICQNTEDLQDVSVKTAKAVNTQTNLLCKQYGAPMLKKRVLFELDQEISIIRTWLKHLKQIEQMAKLLSELERKIDTEQKQKTLVGLVKRYSHVELKLCILYQGLLGIELDNFRRRRVAVLKQILQNLTSFHILGAQRTFNNWNYDNRTSIYEAFLDKFDMLEARISKSRKVQNQVNRVQNNNLVRLQLIKRLNKRPLYFKKDNLFDISVGDKLFGRAITDNGVKMFDCVNARGQRGLVSAENVAVLSELNEAIPGTNIGVTVPYTSRLKNKRKEVVNRVENNVFEPVFQRNKIDEDGYSNEKKYYILPHEKDSGAVSSLSKTKYSERPKQFVKESITVVKESDGEKLNTPPVLETPTPDKMERKPTSDSAQKAEKIIVPKVPFAGQAPVCSTILEDIRESNFFLKSVNDRVLKPEVIREENDFFAELKRKIQKHRLNLIGKSSIPDDASSISSAD